jgi:hypothetical protein
MISSLESKLASLRAAIDAAQSAASKGDREGFAWGGKVHGPGGPTDDKVPAWLSAGEYVLRAAAVNKLPLSFLHLLNSGRYSFEQLLHRLAGQKFNFGGMVQQINHSFAPRFAGGGLVPAMASGPSGQPVFINIGDTRVGPFSGSTGTVETLRRAVLRRDLLSAGRKPGSR